MLAVLFLSLSAIALKVQKAKAQGTIYIMADGSINSPVPANITTSDMVTYTFTGCNHLPIVVNRSNIIINGMGYALEAVGYSYGFSLTSVDNITIENTTITRSFIGISLQSSSGDTFSGNNITANGHFAYGVYLYQSSENVLSGNNVTANSCGINLYSSSGNRIFHNDFLNNTQETLVLDGTLQVTVFNSTNTWDDGFPSGGNYWSTYPTRYPNATEVDSSAIWNASYVIDANNVDRYPLMGPFHTFDVGTWNETTYSVDTVSNSTVTNLSFNQPAKTLNLNVTGANGTVGFCRVAIPLSLMSGDWIVTVNVTQPENLNITTYGNYTYVYFTYHHSTETVQITSTNAIPEFPPFMLLPLLMAMTLFTAIILKKKHNESTVTSTVLQAVHALRRDLREALR
jgi:parallel beta-helix repeat protein